VKPKLLLLAAVLFFAIAARALAGGPYMMVGAAEDVAVSDDPAYSKAEMLEAKLVNFDTIRLTQTWTRGQTALGPTERLDLTNAIGAAELTGIRVILSLYPFGSSVTPLSDQDRSDFASFAVDVAKQFPYVHDFIIGNEPNLNRFWMPQFGANGEDVAAPAYEQLLAQTYDAIKAVRPHSTIYGGALAPRGVDKPNTGRDTHSPTAFITDLGAAYKASGRQVPIMDAFAFHPYPENSQTGPNFAHPNSTSIGLADYTKLVALLGSAFDGTAQHGSSIPILYDEFGIETIIPPAKATLYTGTEPSTTKPVDEATQAQMYTQAMQMAFCQPTVMGLLLFHVQDETALPAWQSGVFYADGTAKSSLSAVAAAVASVHRGVVTTCPALQLTPKLVLKAAKPTKTGTVKVTLTCSVDCTYTVALDARRMTGTATGRLPATIVFRGKLRKGRHVVVATARAALNAGPPASARTSFTSR
jgi:hypothetical protein